jgi:lipopolysaccharide transport system ATP-binding protein
MSNIAISIKGLSKYYKMYKEPKDRLKEALNPFGKKYHHEFYALKNINLEIKKGETLGIVGKNGSGKSTLLKLISGVLSPNSGNIVVNGKIAALLELGAGFNPEFTGLNNIYFYATILGLSNKEIDEKIDDIIAFADLGRFINQPIKTYSSGMKARLGFAVAVHIDPEILILDEVLAVGDALFRRKCYAKMEEFFKSGKTIIYTSHDAESINQLCTRAIFLSEGMVILDGKPKTVTANYQKYLFSTNADKAKVLQEIRNGSPLALNSDDNKLRGSISEAHSFVNDSGFNSGENYLKGFLSTSQVEVKNDKVDIMDFFIENNLGKKVNVLVSGRVYTYRFKVKFDVSADALSFGSSIKTTKGILISSAALHLMDKYVNNVKSGDIYSVKWQFKCILSAGVYHIDTGVAKKVNSEMLFLSRISDAYSFKVVRSDPDVWRGLVHMDQMIDYQKVTN